MSIPYYSIAKDLMFSVSLVTPKILSTSKIAAKIEFTFRLPIPPPMMVKIGIGKKNSWVGEMWMKRWQQRLPADSKLNEDSP